MDAEMIPITYRCLLHMHWRRLVSAKCMLDVCVLPGQNAPAKEVYTQRHAVELLKAHIASSTYTLGPDPCPLSGKPCCLVKFSHP